MSENIQLEPHEVQEIIAWAVSTGAIVAILHDTEYAEDDEPIDIIDRLHGAVELMYHNLPASLVDPCYEMAEKITENAEEDDDEEELIAQFRKELGPL